MATGFEKFSRRALQEEPIVIGRKAEEKVEEPVKTEQPRPAAAERPAVARPVRAGESETRRRGRPKKAGRDTEGLVTVTIQMHPEAKSKLEEMKFREHKNMWELAEEAIYDLYSKYYGN